MAHVPWTSDLETGIPFVDSDHRVLLRLLNLVLSCADEHEESKVLGSVLNSLTDYTRYHFAREERLQELCGYDDIEEHSGRHRILAGEVSDLRDQYLADPQAISFAALRGFLQHWLIDHIVKQDLAYAAVCRGKIDAISEAGAMHLTDSVGILSSAVAWPAVKVLLVEDNPQFARLAETLLRAAGIDDIRIAPGPEEALERLAQRKADIVLTDIIMEPFDGVALAGEIFKIDPRTRVAFVSALDDEDLRKRAASAGIDAYVEKPISPSTLFATITKALSGAVLATEA